MLVEPNIYLYTNLLFFDRTYTSILLVCVWGFLKIIIINLNVLIFYCIFIINILISYFFLFLKSKYYKSKFQYKFRFLCEPTLEQPHGSRTHDFLSGSKFTFKSPNQII